MKRLPPSPRGLTLSAFGTLLSAGLLFADNDPIPDAWESAHFMNPDDPADATVDFDRDGLDALKECQLEQQGKGARPLGEWTATVESLDHLAHPAMNRSIKTIVDLQPDDAAGTLTIPIQRMASPAHDRAIALSLADLTQAEFRHPETGHRFIYQLV